jgi:hypothetical protein
MVGEIDVIFGIPGREAVKTLADFLGRLGGSRPAVVAAHPFILRKTDQHRAAGLQSGRIAAPVFNNVSQTQIVGPVE